ncbi:MAG: transglutaminase family protein [Thiogranum sp.]|nr:transglutaminase family protein [Thiogranum sp.]
MTIRIAIHHQTEYRFDRLVGLSPHILRLRPAPHCRTPIHSYSLKIQPEKHFINWQQDPFGNFQARVVFPDRTRLLRIDVDLVADMTVINPFDFFVEESAEHWPFEYEPGLRQDLTPYFRREEPGPLLRDWLAQVPRERANSIGFLVALNRRLQQDIRYLVRMEVGVQSCEETLQLASGSCRDSAWLLVQILRHLGLAARFVSGYLIQLAPDIKSLDGPSGPEQDFTDLHAWAEVYLPGAGWIGLDPTSGMFAGEGHIPLFCTPDAGSAAPVSGEVDACETEFYFHNRVTRIHEDPRVTRPYSEAQWQAIDALGEAVDARLEAGDTRLTMGGEPTFISIDDMDGAEWNTAALGEHKLQLANALFGRLANCFGSGNLYHFGQGKWYPGEPLPRWALSCYWRRDGQPLWRDPQYLGASSEDYGYGIEQARSFAVALSGQLALCAEDLIPAYEDEAWLLWQESEVPVNIDPSQAGAKDSLDRKRLARLLQKAPEEPTGFVLPLRYADGWRSSRWPLRRGRLFLLPGDSPLGYRLPLDSLPWESRPHRDWQPPRDPFDIAEPLPVMPLEGREQAPREAEEDAEETLIHTALCVEPRDGKLYIFLPPLSELEHFIELVYAIEAVARKLQLVVLPEGYEPPSDPRLQLFRITPDPGVIEVNIHPARDWRELVENTRTLYDQARQARLATEKFMLDGRHTGTGGGNHVTVGGATATDSPLLRRPHLLRSLITYWQQHPALSYLFSSAFIGPTSQAPRVDEARDDNLYELEIAFQQIPDGDCDRPWLADRVLRNLLVDLTGNTHRAEFCIDKLYSPSGPSGRQGLLEFRGFEMPPHWQMSAVQMLLLRALIARFWSDPCKGRLIRWGTELHDRFMLPHFVAQDMHDVVEELRAAGLPFEHAWFAPFIEFRFPVYGRIATQGMELELRWAIEPWHVLGEEVTAQGTSRFVDSSVERLQVKVNGWVTERYLVACNGREVPLRPSGREGEYVAGIRYKAWQPVSGLHPTIGVHAPLVIDIVDRRNGRAIKGCTYHVGHPGGRNYETFPVNANEAEARRVARFWEHGHTPGAIEVLSLPPAGDHPCTLDLRYFPH